MKAHCIGIRREDKNRWERRAPLTPEHVAELTRERGLAFRVQPSDNRIFADRTYAEAGAEVAEDLGPCRVVLAVKEIPPRLLEKGKTYVSFSHTAKGQPANMPALRRMLELGCTLLDYESIVDENGRRLIFFGRHAGYAGMIDTFWALGRRLAWEGFPTPLEEVRLAHEYADLDEALDHLGQVAERLRKDGLPSGLRPVVFAFTGSGNVTQGAQEVFERLPFVEIEPPELLGLAEDRDRPRSVLYRTDLEREHRVERLSDGGYDAEEYAERPEAYRTALLRYLPHITVLVNGIYWEPSHPRLITTALVARLWEREEQPKLRVIGDITCDVGGSIEVNVAATDPGSPVYVYDVESRTARPGVEGRGPVVLAVDNLPCELPREASEHFGDSLMRFVPPLARCDWDAPLERLDLPEALRRAVIAHQGSLTPQYAYLDEHVRSA